MRAIIAFLMLLTTAAAFAEADPRVLHVLVTLPEGTPVEGVEVRCMPQSQDQDIRTVPPTDAERAVTNANGIASFLLTAPLTHIVHAWHGDLGAAKQHFQHPMAEQFSELILEPTRLVSGTIVDPSGAPLEGVRILAFRGIPLGETDAEGRYAFRSLGWLGTPDTVLYKPGYTAHPFTFAFTFGTYDIVLPPGDLPESGAHGHGVPPQPPADAPAITPPPSQAAFREGLAHMPRRGPDYSSQFPVRITVTDRDGTPLPNIGLWLEGGPSAIDSSADGTIVLWHQWEGPVNWRVTRAYGLRRIFVGQFNNHLQYEEVVPVISQAMRAETPDDLKSLRVAVERPAYRILRGRITDDEGTMISTRVKVVPDSEHHRGEDFSARDGWFQSRALPEEPFLLEIMHADYRPKVLASGIHFEPTDQAIEIVLERGPFPPRTSAWTAVTGQPATQEAVDAFPAGDYVREREREYRRHVARATGDAPVYVAPRPPFPVRVVDGAGEPIREIVVQPIRTQGLAHEAWPRHWQQLVPRSRRDSETLQSDDGTYELPGDRMHLWAEGTSWRSFIRGRNYDATRPPVIVLQPPARVHATVRDYSGKRMAGVYVGLPDTMRQVARAVRSTGIQLPSSNMHRTDESGRVDLGEWPVHFDAFAATQRGDLDSLVLIRADLQPGETTELAFILPPWPDGSAAAVLEEWKADERWRSHFLPPAPGPMRHTMTPLVTEDELHDLFIEPLSRRERRAIGKELTRRIESMPSSFTQSIDFSFYARVAMMLGADEAALPLRQWLRRAVSTDSMNAWQPGPLIAERLQIVIKALVALDAVTADWFARAAMDRSVDPAVRVACVLGLGVLGTEESIAAWRELRVAFEAMPAMPVRHADNTHGERMTEAIILTTFLIPRLGTEDIHATDVLPISAQRVDEKYEYGQASMGTFRTASARITLRRFGGDWLVVALN